MRKARADAGRSLCHRVAGWLIAALALANLAALPVDKIDEVVQKTFKKKNGPGAIVVLIEDGKILHTATAGFADVATKRPFTLDTHVDLASVSKAFTAFCVLKLIERGKLKLETDVREHLPELDRAKFDKPIPLENLLAMTGGLPGYENEFDSLTDVDNEAVARAIGKLDPAFEPGTKYEYSNSAYAMAALIVKRVSGQTYPAFAKSVIFDPAGMATTFVLDKPGTPVPERATGYHREETKKKKKKFTAVNNDTGVVGDGQVMTCARDMARWEQALRSGNLIDRKLLNRAFMANRLTTGESTDYGFGWTVGGTKKEKVIEHSGSWDGTATFIRVHLAKGVSILVLSNDEEADANGLADKIDGLIEEE